MGSSMDRKEILLMDREKMSAIPEADQKLSEELGSILDKLISLQDNLYQQRPGCRCDEKRLCAHHAAVYNHLYQARVIVRQALDQVESEG
jgi:transcriptional regulator of aromatic amino acid metabolism